MEYGPGVQIINAGEPVTNTCYGTLATAEAGLQFPGRPRLADYEKDFACFQNATPVLVEEFRKQVLSPELHVAGEVDALKE